MDEQEKMLGKKEVIRFNTKDLENIADVLHNPEKYSVDICKKVDKFIGEYLKLSEMVKEIK